MIVLWVGTLPRLLRFINTVLSFTLSLFWGCHIHLVVAAFHLLSHFHNVKHLIFLHDFHRARPNTKNGKRLVRCSYLNIYEGRIYYRLHKNRHTQRERDNISCILNRKIRCLNTLSLLGFWTLLTYTSVWVTLAISQLSRGTYKYFWLWDRNSCRRE